MLTKPFIRSGAFCAYLEEGDAAARDASFDDLLQQIGAALEANPTLSGLAFGLTYGGPEPSIEAVAGAPAIKSATLVRVSSVHLPNISRRPASSAKFRQGQDMTSRLGAL